MRNQIKLGKDKKDEFVKLIKAYYESERDEEIGDLAASLLIDFITEEIGPHYYNQGILDCYRFIGDKTEDMLGLQK